MARQSDLASIRPLLVPAPAPFDALDPEARAALLAAAARHGLLAQVAGRVPADDAALRTRYERLAAAARLNDARLRQVLEEVLAALGAARVSPVALKGPVLADRLYPDPGLRASTDLDLLVPEPELDRSVAALLGRGFRRGPPLVDAYQRRHLHHVHLLRTPGPDVELHFRPQSAFGALLRAEDLLARAVPHRTTRGAAVRILSPEDELLVLAVHAAGHGLARGGWVLDLILFLERHPDLDWRVLEERARAYRCRRALAFALRHLGELGVAVPPGPVAALGRLRRGLAGPLARDLAGARARRASALLIAFQLVLSDRPWTAPGRILVEAWWVIRRRAHLLARALTSRRGAAPAPR